jgi:hypothetical protein
MDQRILYLNDDGSVSIIVPSERFVAEHGIDALAAKDVPAGKPYKIVSVDDVPADRTFRAAWEADIDAPDGYGIGAEAWFAEQAAKKAAAEQAAAEEAARLEAERTQAEETVVSETAP